MGGVGTARCTVLICDEDREHTHALASELVELGNAAFVARSYAEAFAIACAVDADVLLAAPFVRDGSTLVLPAALGIRRPKVAVLAPRLGERISDELAKRVGYDAQLTKAVSVRDLQRLVRAAAARARKLEAHAPIEIEGSKY